MPGRVYFCIIIYILPASMNTVLQGNLTMDNMSKLMVKLKLRCAIFYLSMRAIHLSFDPLTRLVAW